MKRKEIEKFERIERRLTESHGPFALFALFRPTDSYEWDLVVAAPWAPGPTLENIKKILEGVNAELTPDEKARLSHIILLDPSDPAVRELTEEYPVENGRVEIHDWQFEGVHVDRGFLIASQPQIAKAA